MKRGIILVSAILLLFSSCLSVKIKGKKSKPGKYYEEFFIDQGVMQYFFKPLKFKSKTDFFIVDFTFRDSMDFESYLTANFSVFTDEPLKKVDSAFFLVNNEKINFCCLERMFIDNYRKGFQTRYSSKITFNQLSQFFENEPIILLYYNGGEHYFIPKRKTKKVLIILKQNVIEIIKLNRS